MKLYYSPGACSLASNIVLHEAKLNASFIEVDLKSKKIEQFTVVDAYLFVMLTWARKQGVNAPAELVRYADALAARASVKQALEVEAAAKAS